MSQQEPPGGQRYAACIEYCGVNYSGWQRQKNGIGVQQRLEEALAAVADEQVEVVCAGRTDTGEHLVLLVGKCPLEAFLNVLGANAAPLVLPPGVVNPANVVDPNLRKLYEQELLLKYGFPAQGGLF